MTIQTWLVVIAVCAVFLGLGIWAISEIFPTSDREARHADDIARLRGEDQGRAAGQSLRVEPPLRIEPPGADGPDRRGGPASPPRGREFVR